MTPIAAMTLQGEALQLKLQVIKQDFVERNKREPNVDEFIEFSSKWDEQAGLISLSASPDRSLADLTADLKQIVKHEQKTRGITLMRSLYDYCLPSLKTNFDIKPHQRYLRLYDYKETQELCHWRSENVLKVAV